MTERIPDFGGYKYHMFFGRGPYAKPLPRKPEPAGGEFECRCPSCASEGWYDQSPACKWWRSNCDLCDGKREYRGPNPRIRERCDVCDELWREAVREFRDVLYRGKGQGLGIAA